MMKTCHLFINSINQNLVGADWTGGTHISYSGLKQMLILVNGKKGSMSFFDLRKNNIIRTIDVLS